MYDNYPIRHAIVEWCQRTWVSQLLAGAPWHLASVEIGHLLGLLVWFGTILIVDLRLLGRMFVAQPASEIADDVAPFGYAALAMQAVTGPALFLVSARKMLLSVTLAVKLTLLAIALTYHFTLHRKAVRNAVPNTGEQARVHSIAYGSLALWLGVATAGLWINA